MAAAKGHGLQVAVNIVTADHIQHDIHPSALVKDLLDASSSRMVSPESIIAKVSDRFEVSVEELKSKNKQRRISDARQICMYLIREMTDLSLPRIGELFNRDHTTVLHGYRAVSTAMADDLEIRSMLADMQRELTGR